MSSLREFCAHCGAKLKADEWERHGFSEIDGDLEWTRNMICPNSRNGLLFWHTFRVQYGFTKDEIYKPNRALYDWRNND